MLCVNICDAHCVFQANFKMVCRYNIYYVSMLYIHSALFSWLGVIYFFSEFWSNWKRWRGGFAQICLVLLHGKMSLIALKKKTTIKVSMMRMMILLNLHQLQDRDQWALLCFKKQNFSCYSKISSKDHKKRKSKNDI